MSKEMKALYNNVKDKYIVVDSSFKISMSREKNDNRNATMGSRQVTSSGIFGTTMESKDFVHTRNKKLIDSRKTGRRPRGSTHTWLKPFNRGSCDPYYPEIASRNLPAPVNGRQQRILIHAGVRCLNSLRYKKQANNFDGKKKLKEMLKMAAGAVVSCTRTFVIIAQRGRTAFLRFVYSVRRGSKT